VAFPCPACDQPIDASPERPWLSCPACRATLRSRPSPSEDAPAWEVEVRGAPGTRRRIERAWDADELGRLRRWLAWSSAITVSLVLVLLLAAILL